MNNPIRLFRRVSCIIFFISLIQISACNNNDPEIDKEIGLTGNKEVYVLTDIGDSGISGTITFAEREDNSTLITITLSGTSTGASYPAHIHSGYAADPGSILIVLTNVSGTTGKSETAVALLADGTVITYSELILFNGNLNVHKSDSELGVLVAKGDIGAYALSGIETSVPVISLTSESIQGVIRFAERVNGETLITITLSGTSDGMDHPAHIHANSISENGSILISLNNVDGATGLSETNVAQMDNGTPVTYDDIIDLNGHLKIHQSETNFSTIVATGDVGQNVLTGRSEEYMISANTTDNISGVAVFSERISGVTLITMTLQGTSEGINHATHIHLNTVLEGGPIDISLNNVNGVTGESITNVREKDNGTPITYEDLVAFNGHIVVHPGTGQFTIIAKGDIGQNTFTGESKLYTLTPSLADNIGGTALFEERNNGSTLVTLIMEGTTSGNNHATHIHKNTSLEGGSIVVSFNNINGETGISKTNIRTLDDGTPVSYADLINFDGHIVVHPSPLQFTIVARGDIGQNVLTGETTVYNLDEVNSSGVSGIITFAERESGFSIATIQMSGTKSGDSLPAHIHENSVAEGGSILLTFNEVNGETGQSITNVEQMDNDGGEITYADILDIDGHVIVHAVNFSQIAKGNIGSNSN